MADDVELAENVSIAMLTLLETLGPAERAVFVLREVFDVPYAEIGEAVGKTGAAVRQIAHRANDHIAARRPRVHVVRSEHEQVVARLIAALNTGDLQGLMDALAPDVVSVADSGGKVRGAARRPVVGAERLARYLVGGMAKAQAQAQAQGRLAETATWINGQRGIRMELDGQLVGATSLTIENGKVTRIYSIANPDKLSRLDEATTLSR